jgi:hypothetical protein
MPKPQIVEEKTSRSIQKSEIVIGNTTYFITTKFSDNTKDSVEEKLVKFVAEQILTGVKNTSKTPIAAQN